MPAPEWFTARPDIEAPEQWYLDAFWELSSCRSFTDYSVGPVAWRDIVLFAEVNQIDGSFFPVFLQVIREMDAGYLAWQRAEMERKTKAKP